jgi:hypothetical protein
MTRGGLVQAKICDFSTPWLSRFAVDTVISVNRIFFIGHQGPHRNLTARLRLPGDAILILP